MQDNFKQETKLRLAFAKALANPKAKESHVFGKVLRSYRRGRGVITRKKFWAVIR